MNEQFTETDRHYISLLQENINRMSGNSSSCKTWLVTLVAAILAIQLTSDELRNVLWVALGLIVLFYILDSYYLALERKFVSIEKEFIKQALEKEDGLVSPGLYSFDIKSITDRRATIWSAFFSPSTCPFYLILFCIVLIVCLWPVLFCV